MEASALPASVALARPRIGLGVPLLRLRSDEQLVSLFRAGNEDAFRVIHDRYRARLFAYARQMLGGSAADAEDTVQEIFVRAYSGLRSHDRELALRAWLYRVAHNRCIDEIRRPQPIATEAIEHLIATASPDPMARVEQRDALRRLIADVQRLPEQQRSALLMRELGGMPYAGVSEALGVSVPAVKSLLVRARIGLAQAGEARDTACTRIREDLIVSHDRGVRTSGLSRRHMRDCPNCRQFRSEVRGVSRQFAALVPALGPIGVVAKLLGVGGAGGGGAAAGSGAMATSGAAAGGTGAVGSAGAVAAGAGHVVTLLAAAVVTAGGAIELQRIAPAVGHHSHHRRTVLAAPAKPPPRARATPTAGVPQSRAASVVSSPSERSAAAATVSTAARLSQPSVTSPPTIAPAIKPADKLVRARQASMPLSELIDPDHAPNALNDPASTTPGSATTPTTGTVGTTAATGTTPSSAGTPGTLPATGATGTTPSSTGTPGALPATGATGNTGATGSAPTTGTAGTLPATGTTGTAPTTATAGSTSTGSSIGKVTSGGLKAMTGETPRRAGSGGSAVGSRTSRAGLKTVYTSSVR